MKIIPILIVIAVAVAVAIAIRIYLRHSKQHSQTTHPTPPSPAPAPEEISAEPPASTAATGAAPETEVAPTEESAVTKEPETVAPVAPAHPRTAPGDKPTILVAEDNPSNYKLVEVLLRNDYLLLHAENGIEAIDLFRKHQPALILMDISMPEMDGYEALQGIRALDATVPVIALTAYAFETDKQKMKECGFNSSLAKPLNARELKQTIRHELGLEDSSSNR